MKQTEKLNIMSVKQYGRVHLCLRKYMDSHGITRNALARSINTRFEVVNKWYQDDIEKVDTDILARICFVLGCEIDDLLIYTQGDSCSHEI